MQDSYKASSIANLIKCKIINYSTLFSLFIMVSFEYGFNMSSTWKIINLAGTCDLLMYNNCILKVPLNKRPMYQKQTT